MENQKGSPIESSERQERRDWLGQNVLIPIEDNYRLILNARTVDFWIDFFRGWTRQDILTTLKFVLENCKFAPTAADWSRLRPPKPDEKPEFLTETAAESFARMTSDLKPGTWGHFVMTETHRGLKNRDMVQAYNVIIAEGERRGIADLIMDNQCGNVGLDSFREARNLCVDLRKQRAQGANKPRSGRDNSAVAPEEE